MDVEKVLDLVNQAKSITILLENDLCMQKQDQVNIGAVKVIHRLLVNIEEEILAI